jgi:hypothetical protein
MTDDGSPYRPATADLLRTVAEFLTELGPRLDAGDRYTALVCTHILAMVAREVTHPALPPLDEAVLADSIRKGEQDKSWQSCFEVLLARTIARVAIVKPEHLAECHRR